MAKHMEMTVRQVANRSEWIAKANVLAKKIVSAHLIMILSVEGMVRHTAMPAMQDAITSGWIVKADAPAKMIAFVH